MIECLEGFAQLEVADGRPERSLRLAGAAAAPLQGHRVAAGFSQKELAERAGLSRRGISDLERGERRSPHPATVRRLESALGLGLTNRRR